MKKKGILFSILSMMCVGLATGCNETPSYRIKTEVNSKEYGSATGAGDYKIGSRADLKFKPNLGCKVERIEFKKSSQEDVEDVKNYFDASEDGSYTRSMTITADHIGTYTAVFDCNSNNPSTNVEESGMPLKVTYTLGKKVANGYETITGVYFDSDTTLDNEETIKITDKLDRIKYHDNYDSEIKWFTNEERTIPFDFSAPAFPHSGDWLCSISQ